jgi:hypothetical protein
MSFQFSVNQYQGSGVIGSLYSDAPLVVQSFILNSASAANNVYGRAFTKNAVEGYAYAGGTPAGNVSFAGFLVDPKITPSYGTSAGGPLAPTLTLQNGQVGSFLTRGFIYVNLPAPAIVGDNIYYNVVTGELVSANTHLSAPTAPAGTAFAHARVAIFNVTLPGLAIIEVIDVPLQEYFTP